MAGPRDDGTFAEDKSRHPNRKVGRSNIRQDGAAPQDWLKHGPACDYCGAGSGQPCKDGCVNT